MNSVVAISSIVAASTVAIIGAFLLFRLIRTMLELRKVTTGLNSALGWALGQVSAEANASRPAAGQTRQLLP
jgi:glucose uptake protein GlcU